MKRAMLLIGVALWAALALPAGAAIELPRTVEEQGEWLGGFYAAGLEYHYGRYGLTPEAIGTATGDLVRGLSATLEEPLDARQLSEISAWVFRTTASVGALDIAPPPLQLKQDVGDLVHIIGLYLSRPRLTHEQQDQIAGQLGVVLDVLRAAMLEELSEVPGGEALVREAVYSRAAGFGRRIGAPVAPLIKRLYTAEEIEELCAHAREIPVGDYQQYLSMVGMSDPEAPNFEKQVAVAAKWTIHGATWLLRNKVLGAQYTPPVILTPDEEAALLDYYLNTHGALWSEPPESGAMQERAEEESW